jgi:hypothetical protein
LQFDVTASTVAETAATLSGPLPSSYIAGSPGAKHVTLTVTRIAGSTGSVSVNFATSDGTATAGADYLAQAGTLFFADGQTSQTIRIPILDDGTIEGGSETFNVTLSSPGGGAVLGSQTTQVVTIADPDLAVLPITSVEGASFSGQVATFAGSNPAVAAGDYAAAISWGDGTAVSSGTITPNGSGGFNVTASHTYAEEGSFPIAVTITGGDTISGTNTATVADASLTATGTKLNVTGTKKFSGTVATFTDADPGGTVGDYSATITWDDGTTSAGTVAGSGPFTVSGSHTFPTFSGLHRITIAISDAGGSSATVDDAVKDPTPNQHFVMQLYNDLLQRPADNDGLAAWTTLLDQGVSRRQVALDFEASREFHQELVQNLYSQLLGRAADAAGLAGWTQFLDQGGTSVELEALLLGSAEYFNNHGGSYGGWLDALYQDVLHRPADQPGAQAWIRDLAQGASRDAVALAILHSPEAEETTIDGWYRNCLRRRADPGGLQAFATDLELGMTPDQVLALILASDEYFSRG